MGPRFALGMLLLVVTAAARGQKPELVVQTGKWEQTECIAFSPDGRVLAAGTENKTIKIWDVATGDQLRTLNADNLGCSSLAFSPDGRILASGSEDGTIKLWDPVTGRNLRTIPGASRVVSVAFSPDAHTLASVAKNNIITLWNVVTGNQLRTLISHTQQIWNIAFGPGDGRTLASASEDGKITFWEVATGRELRTLEGAGSIITFSPDGRALASGTSGLQNGVIKLWDAATGRELRTIARDEFHVECLAISPDGRILASAFEGADDFSISLWDIATGGKVRSLRGHTLAATRVAISPDGRMLASGQDDGSTKLWDLAARGKLRNLDSGYPPLELRGADQVWALGFSPNSRVLASGRALWDTATGRNQGTIPGQSYLVSVAFSPDGMVAAGQDDGEIVISKLASGQELRTLLDRKGEDDRTDDVFSVAFGPSDGRILASASPNGLKLWDVGNGRELRTLEQHETINSIAFSPDGHTLASGGATGLLKLWDVASGRELRTIVDPPGIVSVAFSPDGHTLATGNYDPTIVLWDVATGDQLRILTGHTSLIDSVTFSPDGRFLVSASEDGSTRVWEARTGRQLAALYFFDQNDWAVVDPQGRFDASPGGMALMHYVVAKQCGASASTLEAIELDQLKNRYYEPGLLAKTFGFDKEPLRDVDAFDHVDLYPNIQVLSASNSLSKLNVKLTSCGGGVGPVQIFVNDKQFIADARGPNPDSNAQETTLTVNLKRAPVIPGQHNAIRIVAWNTQAYVHSRSEILDYSPESGTLAKGFPRDETSKTAAGKYQGDLYAIISGISKYSNQQFNLNFSSNDAESMAKALQLAGDRLFGCGHVHIFLFSRSSQTPAAVSCSIGSSTSADEVSWAAPTKANIQQAFTATKKAHPQDVLVVYFSGHGVAFGDTYAYPTANANTIDPNDFSRDSRLLSQTAITGDELANWVNQEIPATHEVMILDTCAAGAAALRLTQPREVSSDQTRALDRLKDNTGFHLLMGSAADAVSYEATPYRQGLLTYATPGGNKRGSA